MTIVSGVRIVAAPCCGARYAVPRYLSVNFMASAYWTDGWRDGSLMPNDEGLRRCQCGRFVLKKDLVKIDTAEASDRPDIDSVPDYLVPECIAKADSEDLEVAARLTYWRQLNHPYRQEYRQHRKAEEAATKAAWEAANPDRRTWWDRLRRHKPPSYTRPPDSPFTFAAYEPTYEQRQNMKRLSELLLKRGVASRSGLGALTLAELYREQGRFDEAQGIIRSTGNDEEGSFGNLIAKLIQEKQPAPLCYRI
jgi:hypothetical protein